MDRPTECEVKHAAAAVNVDARLFRQLHACTMKVRQRLRSHLYNDFATSLAYFEVMSQLEKAPQGLSMAALARRMSVTGSSVTVISRAMVNAGLLLRELDRDDKRICRLKLTEHGRRQLSAMSVSYSRWVIEHFKCFPTRNRDRLLRLLSEFEECL